MSHLSASLDRSGTRLLAVAYLLYALIAVVFLAIEIPPFQNPDETAHFRRAAQLAHGALTGVRFWRVGADGSMEETAGGWIDSGLTEASSAALRSRHHHTPAPSDTAAAVQWSGIRQLASFRNTVLYPPFFYAVLAIGVRVGQALHWPVVKTLILSRLLSGLAAAAIGAAAIDIAGAAGIWIFAILSLPMSLALDGSVSQNGLLLTCSALMGASMIRVIDRPGPRDGTLFAILVAMLGLVAMARPPYAGLALLLLGFPGVQVRWRIAAVVFVLACVSIWSLIAAMTSLTDLGSRWGADPHAQLVRLLDDPLSIGRLVWTTLRVNSWAYYMGFVGIIEGFRIPLPHTYYIAAGAMLIVAALATMLRPGGSRIERGQALLIVAGLLVSAAAVFGIQYLTWTTVGDDTVDGVQGRYFLPLALAGAALLPAFGDKRTSHLQWALLSLVAAFPALSLYEIIRAVEHFSN